jgi:hypothetical protein
MQSARQSDRHDGGLAPGEWRRQTGPPQWCVVRVCSAPSRGSMRRPEPPRARSCSHARDEGGSRWTMRGSPADVVLWHCPISACSRLSSRRRAGGDGGDHRDADGLSGLRGGGTPARPRDGPARRRRVRPAGAAARAQAGWRCHERACPRAHLDRAVEAIRTRPWPTERARQAVRRRVGRHAEPVAVVARDLGSGWHAVMRATRPRGGARRRPQLAWPTSPRSEWTRSPSCRHTHAAHPATYRGWWTSSAAGCWTSWKSAPHAVPTG